MANCSTHTEMGSVKYLLASVVSLGIIFSGVWVFSWAVDKPTDLDAKRSVRRIELREKVAKDENSKILAPSKAEWLDKEAGLAKLPLSAAIDQAVTELRNKQPTPTAVKKDPILNLGADAPKMPSSPSGAATVRFSTIAPSVPVKTGN